MTTDFINMPLNPFEMELSESFSPGSSLYSSDEYDSFMNNNPEPSENDGLSDSSKKIRKKRTAYNRIDDDLRIKLLDAVQMNGETLKSASKRLNINYSSAKSIIHTYRKEGRILKKNTFTANIKIYQYPATEYIDICPAGGFSLQSRPYTQNQSYSQSYNNQQYPGHSTSMGSISSAQDVTPSHSYVETKPANLNNDFGTLLLKSQQYFEEQNKENKPQSQVHGWSVTPKIKLNDQSPIHNFYNTQSFHHSPSPQAFNYQFGHNQNQSLVSPTMNLSYANSQSGNAQTETLNNLDGFYMNYWNSPLSGAGSMSMFKESSDSSSRRRNYEFESFSDMVTAIQQPQPLTQSRVQPQGKASEEPKRETSARKALKPLNFHENIEKLEEEGDKLRNVFDNHMQMMNQPPYLSPLRQIQLNANAISPMNYWGKYEF